LSQFLTGSRLAKRVCFATAILTLMGGVALAASGPAAAASSRNSASNIRRACPVTNRAGQMACMVLVRTDVKQRTEAQLGPNVPTGYGYGPSQLDSAYKLPSSTAGAGQIVAVVDAYNDPTAVSDVATYRSAWGLPACNTTTEAGCLTVVNQSGAASPLPTNSGDTGWATEESLDVDMVSAICPKCHIYLVEADGPSTKDLGTGVDSAVKVLHAEFVSNSYGGRDSSRDASNDKLYYKHKGVAVTASAGDDGYGVSYPAASKDVTAVGGTSLNTASNSRGWTETVWSGTGSGCSGFEKKPTWQTDSGCSRRTNNDVAAVANPNTGVAIYDTYDQGGWLEVGGTSVSSPIIASVFALAGTPAAKTFPTSYIYMHTSNLYDVTSGNDGSCSPAYLCTGEVGYDGPTGWGTPHGTAAFTS
jgi:subtilase family serine protease